MFNIRTRGVLMFSLASQDRVSGGDEYVSVGVPVSVSPAAGVHVTQPGGSDDLGLVPLRGQFTPPCDPPIHAVTHLARTVILITLNSWY